MTDESAEAGGSDAVAGSGGRAGSGSWARWFADLPAFDGEDAAAGCYWFADLRFLTPGREWLPFRFGVCKEGPRSSPGAPWRAFERLDLGGKAPL